MSDWKRTTKEASLEGLAPEMVAIIHRHIEQHNLGSILSDLLMCIQTDSEKIKRGLFAGKETVRMSAIVTPRWLVWAVEGTQTRPAVLSAQLVDITVQDYAQTSFAKLVPDSGVQISGMFTDASESVSAFIGLDQSAAARKFRDALIQAAQVVRK